MIGAGTGGMTAAAYLAAAGKRALLLEQHSVLGGCSHVFRREKKWKFEVGVHYIGDCGPNGQVPTILRGPHGGAVRLSARVARILVVDRRVQGCGSSPVRRCARRLWFPDPI